MLRLCASILFAASLVFAAELAPRTALAQSGGYHHGANHHGRHGSGHGYGYGVYGGGHASTAAEGYLRGRADLARGVGLYNLYTSAAARNYEEAAAMRIENRRRRAETYFAMREANAIAREKARRRRSTPEEIAQWNDARRPRRLTRDELEPVLGAIAWPTALQDDRYADSRSELERLFAERTLEDCGEGSDNCQKIQRAARNLRNLVDQQVKQLSTSDFLESRKFVDSLAYEARFDLTQPALVAMDDG